MKYRDLVGILAEDGWQHVRTTGSHLHYRHLAKKGVVTVPGGGKLGRDVPPGMLKAVLRQARLSREG